MKTFEYTPNQLRYIAAVSDALNSLPQTGKETDDADIGESFSITIPEGQIAEIYWDWSDKIWAIRLTPPESKLRTLMQEPEPWYDDEEPPF
jgi:hypothetical protein